MSLVIGLLGNKNNSDTSLKWQGIEDGLAVLGHKCYYLDAFETTEEINNARINMLFTINKQGMDKWKHLLELPIPFVMWSTGFSVDCIELIQSYRSRINFVVLSDSGDFLNYIRYRFPEIKQSVFYDVFETFYSKDKEENKVYDVSYIGDISDIRSIKNELKQNLSNEAYQIMHDIVTLMLRNSEMTLWEAYRYYSLIYGYDNRDHELFIDLYTKLSGYITDMKKINILSKLKGQRVHIWGDPLWKKYLPSELKYMGDISSDQKDEIIRKSKIVLNIDDSEYVHSLNPYVLKIMSNKTLPLTTYNIHMQREFPQKDYDIYYSLMNNDHLKLKMNDYLDNPEKILTMTEEIYDHVSLKFTWQERMKKFETMFVAGSK
jgi:hypothetical protein